MDSKDENAMQISTRQLGIELSGPRSVYMICTRSTTCDVVSITTTTTLLERGTLRNVQQMPYTHKKRLPICGSGLFDEGIDSLTSEQLHQRLHLEKRLFMTTLRMRRIEHEHTFASMAIRIQCNYRRHLVSKHWERIQTSCLVRKELRALARGKHHRRLVTTLKRYNTRQKFVMHRCAEAIQISYRLHLEALWQKREKSRMDSLLNVMATKIQCLRRKSIARHRTASLVLEKYFNKQMRIGDLGAFQLSILYRTTAAGINVAASMIQRTFRKRIKLRSEQLQRQNTAIYYLRNKSAKCIQAVFRGRRVRKHFARLGASITKLQSLARRFLAARMVKRLKGERIRYLEMRVQCATKIQKVVRSRLTRLRVQVIKDRLAQYKVFYGATRFQSIIRGYIARVQVGRKRAEKESAQRVVKVNRLSEEKTRRDEQQSQHEHTVALAGDIFYHSSLGHAAIVDRLFNDLSAEPPRSIRDVNDKGETILLVASAVGFVDIVQRCVWWGFNINHRNKDEETAIMLAAKNGHEQVVNFLLDLPTIASKDKYKPKALVIKTQDTAVMTTCAARSDNTRILKKLVEYGVVIDARLPLTGESALQVACESNHLEVIRFLMTQHCNIVSADDKGVTALMKACASSSQATRILLGLSEESHVLLKKLDKETAALLCIKDHDYKDCYTHAALNGRSDVLEMFSQIVAVPVSSKSFDSDASGASHLHEVDIELKSPIRRPPHWSRTDATKVLKLVREGAMDCLAVLLEEGFNPLLVDEDSGTSMFMCACECGRIELVEALLRRGLNFSGLDGAGRCCFHYAARCATHGMVDVILQNPSMTKCKISDSMLVHIDNEGDNILHVAGRSGAVIPLAVLSSDSWRTCLQQSNDAGHTPLHEACKARQHVVMRHYLSLGASAADLDSSGRSPLWLYLHRSTVAEGLEDKDFGEAALMLLKAGCDLYPLPLDAIDALKSTPLSLSESPNPGDFAVQQLDGMVLSEITAMCIARSDLETVVRLVISSLLYDKPGCRAMRSLLDRSTISLLGDKVYWGYSLLGWATALNSVDAVEFLLVYGGLPWNQKVDDRGNTCLHLAAMHDHEELIKKIVIKGNVAHIDAKNFSHSTAAMLAAKHGSFGALQLLYRRYGASARLALDGKYWGWVLALALQEVRVRN